MSGRTDHASPKVSARALKIARQTMSEPDTRARVRVQLATLCGLETAQMVDDMVVMARELLTLNGERL